jgi:hypothetical protein
MEPISITRRKSKITKITKKNIVRNGIGVVIMTKFFSHLKNNLKFTVY